MAWWFVLVFLSHSGWIDWEVAQWSWDYLFWDEGLKSALSFPGLSPHPSTREGASQCPIPSFSASIRVSNVEVTEVGPEGQGLCDRVAPERK